MRRSTGTQWSPPRRRSPCVYVHGPSHESRIVPVVSSATVAYGCCNVGCCNERRLLQRTSAAAACDMFAGTALRSAHYSLVFPLWMGANVHWVCQRLLSPPRRGDIVLVHHAWNSTAAEVASSLDAVLLGYLLLASMVVGPCTGAKFWYKRLMVAFDENLPFTTAYASQHCRAGYHTVRGAIPCRMGYRVGRYIIRALAVAFAARSAVAQSVSLRIRLVGG